MSKETFVTIYQVVERKFVTEKDPRFFAFTRLERISPIVTSDGDLLAEFPNTATANRIEVPVHRFRCMDERGLLAEKLVAIHPDAMQVFDAMFEEERRSVLDSLQAERLAHRITSSRIERLKSLPLLKRIWRAIRKDI